MKKKMFIAILALLVILSTLTGCGHGSAHMSRCDFCADEKKCETRTLFGDKVEICADCQAFMGTVFQ